MYEFILENENRVCHKVAVLKLYFGAAELTRSAKIWRFSSHVSVRGKVEL